MSLLGKAKSVLPRGARVDGAGAGGKSAFLPGEACRWSGETRQARRKTRPGAGRSQQRPKYQRSNAVAGKGRTSGRDALGAFARHATKAANPARGLPAGGSGEAARACGRAERVAGTNRGSVPRVPRYGAAGEGPGAGQPDPGTETRGVATQDGTGHRWDGGQGPAPLPEGALGDDPGATPRRDVPARARPPGGNPQTWGRKAGSGHPDGCFILHLQATPFGIRDGGDGQRI